MTQNTIKPLLSIIIPVYNLQDYVVKALDSIYSQQENEDMFEVIAVDDGSTDNSLTVITEYANRHTNIQVYTQPNGGVSRARNLALQHVHGIYLTFLDADDRFAENSLSQLFRLIQCSSPADVIYCRSFVLYPSGDKELHLWQSHFNTKNIYNGNNMIAVHYLNGGSVWGGLYRTCYIREQQLSFPEGVANAEDTIFNYILYSRNPRIMFANLRLNLVTVREGSASRSKSIERARLFANNMTYIINYCSIRTMNKDEQEILDMAAYQSISLAVNMYIDGGGQDWEYMKTILRLNDVLPLHIRRLKLDQLVKVFLLNYCGLLYFNLIRFLKRKS